MCDTLVALSNSTADGSVIFAKNSDREPNEAHHLLLIPAAEHVEGESIQCTYLQIPQVLRTYTVLLAKPFWIWGAEMGANERGVVIGNEAVFTRVPYEKTPGLIGMDFLRLALERAGTAIDALQLITGLLEIYGQSGSCGLTHPFYYHNSFLIADLREAWILETAGRQWAARRVKDFGSISNAITIGRDWDLASPNLVNFAMDQGWCKQRERFHFADCYSDFLYTRFSAAVNRQGCTTGAMRAQRGKITPASMMAILRSHQRDGSTWTPGPAVTGADVCMHAGWGPIRGSQTTGSMVAQLTPEMQTHWVTATAAPCTSIFKPVWLDTGLPDTGPVPDDTCDSASLWWRHEQLHRDTLQNYSARLAAYRGERDRLEAQFVAGSEPLRPEAVSERKAYSEACFQQADQAKKVWQKSVRAVARKPGWWFYYRQAWKRFDRLAKIS